MQVLQDHQERVLERLAKTLIDQRRARIAVAPMENAPGFWFGGGNMVQDAGGDLYLCGRYRNSGDSRTGLEAGVRGAELAIFRSPDRGRSFEKILSFSKEDLSYGERRVLSIERCWLLPAGNRVELFVSSEKQGLPYPEGYEAFQKPGTGVWSIDSIAAPSIADLDPKTIQPLLQGSDPRYCHYKDPVAYRNDSGETVLMFSTHPFNWASSNTALALRPAGTAEFSGINHTFFPRGFTWDVAVSRISGVLRLPRTGLFEALPTTWLYFYDGAESMRDLTEHGQAVRRPRGYSCEELGGAAYSTEQGFPHLERLSRTLPFFVSPHGTGCSRYATALHTGEGVYTTWQQSQPDRSQPLVLCFTEQARIEALLTP